jgi:hypothetical protein
VAPGSPGCLPGRRFPRSRSDRSRGFLYGLSDDGGRDEVDESIPARRSSSSTRSCRRLISADCSAQTRYASESSRASPACGSADSSSAEDTPGTPGTARKPAPQPASSQQPATACPAARNATPATSHNIPTLAE